MLPVSHGVIKILSRYIIISLFFVPVSVLSQDEAVDDQIPVVSSESEAELLEEAADAGIDAATATVEDALDAVSSPEEVDAAEETVAELIQETPAESLQETPTETVEEVTAEVVEESATETPEGNRRSVRRLGIDQTEEFSLDLSAPIIAPAPVSEVNTPDVTLPNAEQDSQLQDVLVRLALNPSDAVSLRERNAILADVITQAGLALANNQLNLARRLTSAVNTVNTGQAGLSETVAAIAARATQNQALADANADLAAGRLFAPAEANAFSRYTALLAQNPDNQGAIEGMDSLLSTVIDAAKAQAEAGNYEAALELLNQAGSIPNGTSIVAAARSEVSTLLTDVMAAMNAATVTAIDNADFVAAETQITQLVALGYSSVELNRLRARLADARLYGGFKPGQQLSEAFTGGRAGSSPPMIVVPAGEYLMGASDGDGLAHKSERPQRRVTVKRGFAVAQHETTVDQFRSFVDDTSYRTDAEKAGKSRVYDEKTGTLIEKERVNWRHDYHGDNADSEMPVLHVSWNDASAYANWLSQRTERTYRLPTEAEFEYVLRSGSQTIYWWGDGAPENVVANLTGDRDKSDSRRRWTDGFDRYKDGFWGPAPVMTFISNPFGIFDMGGNVSEWVEDCWHSSYSQAPSDTSAWVNPGCTRRMIRGASWSSDPKQARSSARVSAAATSVFSRVGFRVVRDL